MPLKSKINKGKMAPFRRVHLPAPQELSIPKEIGTPSSEKMAKLLTDIITDMESSLKGKLLAKLDPIQRKIAKKAFNAFYDATIDRVDPDMPLLFLEKSLFGPAPKRRKFGIIPRKAVKIPLLPSKDIQNLRSRGIYTVGQLIDYVNKHGLVGLPKSAIDLYDYTRDHLKPVHTNFSQDSIMKYRALKTALDEYFNGRLTVDDVAVALKDFISLKLLDVIPALEAYAPNLGVTKETTIQDVISNGKLFDKVRNAIMNKIEGRDEAKFNAMRALEFVRELYNELGGGPSEKPFLTRRVTINGQQYTIKGVADEKTNTVYIFLLQELPNGKSVVVQTRTYGLQDFLSDIKSQKGGARASLQVGSPMYIPPFGLPVGNFGSGGVNIAS